MTDHMKMLQSLDAHAHVDPARTSEDLANSGAVLAMTISLDEAALAVDRHEAQIVWGVGCHPRKAKYQEAFDSERFTKLAERTPIIGEIGLDSGSRVPIEVQLRTFRHALATVAEMPRLVSIHAYRSTGLVVKELSRNPINTPILHWWTGSVEETRQAVELGCYFSVHSAVARHSKFRTAVPRERLLIESDHGYSDPPAAIPCRVEWVEHLLATQLRLDKNEVRRLVWRNFAAIVHKTGTLRMFPKQITSTIAVEENAGQQVQA
jgi:TatD DNase family protein